jgi:hypothetical protein
MAVCQGAALAVARKLSVEQFLRRGAAIGLQVQPSYSATVLLDSFGEVSDTPFITNAETESSRKQTVVPWLLKF